jgi:hypothetical protein
MLHPRWVLPQFLGGGPRIMLQPTKLGMHIRRSRADVCTASA